MIRPKALLLAGLTLGSLIWDCSARATLDPLSPWPTAGHDLRHTSRAPFIGPRKLQVRWTLATGALTVWTPVVGRDGTIYVPVVDPAPNNSTTSGGRLIAVTPGGVKKWDFDLHGVPCQNAVIGDDGTIYATGASLYAISPAGKELWEFNDNGNANFQTNMSPTFGPDILTGTIKHSILYQPTFDGQLFAMDVNSATPTVPKWSRNFGIKIQAPISFALDGSPIVSLREGGVPNVFQVNSADGTTEWSWTGPDQMRSATVGDDGSVYVAAESEDLYALDSKGNFIWSGTTRDSGSTVVEFPALGLDGSVYVGSGEGEMASFSPKGTIDPSTQEMQALWRFEPDPYFKDVDANGNPITGTDANGNVIPVRIHMGTPIVDALGMLYIPSPQANLWEIDSKGNFVDVLVLPVQYEALFTRMGMAADGTIYDGSNSELLYAFGENFVIGDADGDGKVTLKDAILTLQKALGILPTTPQDIRALDVSPLAPGNGRPYGDGKITIGDVISILVQAINPSPTWPYPGL